VKELRSAKEPRRARLLADVHERQGDERYLTKVAAADQRLIRYWRARL
jgi:hypothetical protein